MRNEKELIQLLQDGREEAIKVIFDEYYESLCLYSEGIIKNHQVAEEIVEDLFIYIWLHSKSSPINSSLKNYLYKSTYNNSLKYIRKARQEKKLLKNLDYTLEDEELLYPVSHLHPLSDLFTDELKVKVEKALESLPDQCRLIYSLNRYENLSYSEIAKKLNIAIGTVKTQMSRAFKKFRKELQEFLPLILFMTLIRIQ
jgi:RNA polymerase sigma-70 factor (ECF subfamily)